MSARPPVSDKLQLKKYISLGYGFWKPDINRRAILKKKKRIIDVSKCTVEKKKYNVKARVTRNSIYTINFHDFNGYRVKN